jgi:type I restriction enzyme M protein
MNLLLHGVENPTMERADSLAETHPKTESYTLVLANPPFAGSLNYETTASDLLDVVRTKKTELLFLALSLRLLKNGGRAAVIVPDGVLFGSSTAHKELRRILVEEHKLDAVVKLPSGVFKPYAGVSTAILFFTKTSSGGTENVWFYDVQADGYSLDDKRTPLDAALHEKNNLPDVLARWSSITANPETELARPRTAQSFMVPKTEIAAQGYDLSLNRYKEVEHVVVVHRSPTEILDELTALDADIAAGLAELRVALETAQ